MTHVQIVGIVLGTILVILLIWFITLLIVKNKKPKDKSRETEKPEAKGGKKEEKKEEEKKKRFYQENYFFTIIGFVLFEITFWIIFTWWSEYMWNDSRMWSLQVILLGFILLIPKGKNPLHHTLGKWGVRLIIFGIAWILLGRFGTFIQANTPPKAPLVITNPGVAKYKYDVSGGRRNIEVEPAPTLPSTPSGEDPEVVAKLEEAFRDTHPDLIAFAEQETHKNQWSWTDGKPDHSKPLHAHLDDGTRGDAVGVLQIKSENLKFCNDHAEEPPLDLNDLEGNLECAAILYQEYGLKPWHQKPGTVISFPVVITDSEWSKPFKLPDPRTASFKLEFAHDAQVRINGNNKRIVTAGPTHTKDNWGDNITSLEFQGPAEGRITYTYR